MPTLDNETLMFMIVLNGDNYLQKTIALVLIFWRRSKRPRTMVREKKKQKQKKNDNKNRKTGSQAKDDDTWQGI